MRVINDFRCSATNVVFERYADRDAPTIKCQCGADAKRIISPVKCQLEGHSGDFPGAHMKWIREHEKRGQTG